MWFNRLAIFQICMIKLVFIKLNMINERLNRFPFFKLNGFENCIYSMGSFLSQKIIYVIHFSYLLHVLWDFFHTNKTISLSRIFLIRISTTTLTPVNQTKMHLDFKHFNSLKTITNYRIFFYVVLEV